MLVVCTLDKDSHFQECCTLDPLAGFLKQNKCFALSRGSVPWYSGEGSAAPLLFITPLIQCYQLARGRDVLFCNPDLSPSLELSPHYKGMHRCCWEMLALVLRLQPECLITHPSELCGGLLWVRLENLPRSPNFLEVEAPLGQSFSLECACWFFSLSSPVAQLAVIIRS